MVKSLLTAAHDSFFRTAFCFFISRHIQVFYISMLPQGNIHRQYSGSLLIGIFPDEFDIM